MSQYDMVFFYFLCWEECLNYCFCCWAEISRQQILW